MVEVRRRPVRIRRSPAQEDTSSIPHHSSIATTSPDLEVRGSSNLSVSGIIDTVCHMKHSGLVLPVKFNNETQGDCERCPDTHLPVRQQNNARDNLYWLLRSGLCRYHLNIKSGVGGRKVCLIRAAFWLWTETRTALRNGWPRHESGDFMLCVIEADPVPKTENVLGLV